jgi:hypothetical protein
MLPFQAGYFHWDMCKLKSIDFSFIVHICRKQWLKRLRGFMDCQTNLYYRDYFGDAAKLTAQGPMPNDRSAIFKSRVFTIPSLFFAAA